jgi:DNA-binding NarL/FixJ family response regulator
MIRIVHADYHTFSRDGFAFAMSDSTEFKVLAQAADGAGAIALTERLRPDVVLLDLSMPNIDGLTATAKIKKISSTIKVIILSVHEHRHYALRALQGGADGYMHKRASQDEVRDAIRKVHSGKRATPSHLADLETTEIQPSMTFKIWELSRREQQVFYLLADCRTNHEVADELGVNVKTVDTHRGHILKKLGLRSNAELTRFAIKNNLIDSQRR